MYDSGTQSRLTPDGKPLPVITPLNDGFFAHARKGVFSIQTCRGCGDRHIPESPVCPRCLSEDQEWEPASGRGTLESWVEFHRAYWDGFKADLPYLVGLVRLDEGPLFIARLNADESALKCGAPVRIVFRDATERIAIPEIELA